MDKLYYAILDLHDLIGLNPNQLIIVIVALAAVLLIGMAINATQQ